VPYPLVLSDSNAGRADPLAPGFACAASDGGRRAARQVDDRLVLFPGPRDVDRIEPPIEARLTAVGGDQSASEGHQS
jgi:hypothetical protein